MQYNEVTVFVHIYLFVFVCTYFVQRHSLLSWVSGQTEIKIYPL